MKLLHAMALAAALGSLSARAAADYTDLWFNPAQSGWGVNLVQQGETAFATLFVYGPDRQPTWYSASNLRVVSLTASGLPNFEGSLHRTTGPWYGGSFDPSTVTLSQVGTLYVQGVATDRLRLTYIVEGREMSAEVVRASLAAPQPAFYYHGSLALRESPPGGAPYGTARYAGDFTYLIENGSATLRFAANAGPECVYTGAYSQAGRIASVAGTFNCTAYSTFPARSGTFTLEDVEVTVHGITGYLRTQAPDRHEAGRFAAGRL